MKIGVTTWRVITYAVKNLTRNAWLGLATVFVLVLSLLSVNILIGVNALMSRSVSILEDRVDISVFFKSDTPEAVLEQARFFMASLPQVKSSSLLTPEEALSTFQRLHADDMDILGALQELDENPFGASLVIQAHNSKDYPFLLEALKNPQFEFAIESKTYDDHAEAISRVRDLGKSSRLFGSILIALFAFFSILIVYNAVRVAIYTQREEIGIMRLVGASGSFVRIPFVVEGLLLACFALVIAGALIAGVVVSIEPSLVGFFGGADPGLVSYFSTQFLKIIAIEGGGLFLLVSVSSWAAVGRYSKR
ncbi:MAG: permease-like cell division protein FtsX [bacterium]|nr:permease-like cell division protein FtsX [bacterium]